MSRYYIKISILLSLGLAIFLFQNCAEFAGDQDVNFVPELRDNEVVVDDMIIDSSMLVESEYSDEALLEERVSEKGFTEMSEEDIQTVQAIKEKNVNLWPGGIVRYKFSKEVTKKDRDFFLRMCWEMGLRANISCRPKRAKDKDFIHVRKTNKLGACGLANLGRISYKGHAGHGQIFLIKDSCWYNRTTIKHELMHTLGFTHEHQRFDRDRYIRFDSKNLKKDFASAFRLVKRINTHSYTRYDYKSILHYSSWGGSKNGQPTFYRRDNGEPVYKAKWLSRHDHRALIRLYGRREVKK